MAIAGRGLARRALTPPQWWARGEGPQFVGRAEELRALDQAWRWTVDGRRQAVLVLGEAGAGKSRLIAEASGRFAEHGAAVLVGCCMPDAPVAYEPFRAPLGRLVDDLDGIEGHALDAVRGLLAAQSPMDGPSPKEVGPTRAPEAFEAVVSLLRRASAERPIIVVVEDLHWATPSTVNLLSWIVRRAPDTRVLVLITARNTRPALSATLRATLAELYREPGVRALELSGLTIDEVASMVATEAGLDPARAPMMADRLLAQTAGNPFLLQEICRDLRRRGDPGDAAAAVLHIPETVRSLFGERILQFPEHERRVLELSAVLGDRFPARILEAVTDSAVETMPALDRAIDLGLLTRSTDDQGFAFPHALARQSVLDLTPPARLAAWHARVADVLEARSGQTLPEVQRLAHHNLNAYGRVAKARHYLLRAAELADRSWAYAEAAQHYRRAAELSDTVTERHRLLLRSADALQDSGNYGAAQEVAEQVTGEAVDAATRLAAATLVEREATLLGGDLHAVQLLVEALTQYPRDLRDPEYLRGLVGLSRGLGQVLDSPDAVRLHHVVLAEARRLGDTRVLAHVLAGGLPLAFGRPGLTNEALLAARELTTLARPDDAENLGTSGFFRCLLGLRAGSMDDVRAGVVDYRLAYDRGGHLWFAYWPQVIEYDLRFMRGDFSGAAQTAAWLRDWIVEHNDVVVGAHYGVHLFQIHRETGQLDGVREVISGQEPASGCWAPALLALYTELRMPQPARRLLDALADGDTLRRNRRTEYMPAVLAYLVEAALFLDDRAMLRRLRPQVAEHRGLNLVSDQFVALSGAADRYLGMIDATVGDADPIPAFDAAAELARRCGFTVDLALTLTARARHLSRIHGPAAPDVVDAVAKARALAEPIGQHRVLKALPGLTAHPPGPRPVTDSRLTKRELQVLRFLCQGATNREIAQQLSISQNTAANHVRAILTKTSSANRTQAALLAVSRGWVTPA